MMGNSSGIQRFSCEYIALMSPSNRTQAAVVAIQKGLVAEELLTIE
ncbi:hypothetical protein PN499_14395 [Kamptonema animale CS-326]|nr:hypothetical protein [Kamptonema animale]MDB9512378.1 hypothetical protein [Kamptonema animale CS-326]